MFQSYALFPHLNVFDNVAFGLRRKKVSKDDVDRRVKDAMALVDLIGFEGRRPPQMSGGQQQRVALARALALQPKVLLMDEPLSNLDYKLQIRLRTQLKELMHRLYGRRTERQTSSPDQLPLDFGDDEPIPVVPDVREDEAFVEEHQQKRRRRRRRRQRQAGGRFPEHIERRTERIEPELPEGIRREYCELIGVDVVEILDFDRPRLWVRRLEYPKYKIPSQPQLNIVHAVQQVIPFSEKRSCR